jgi:hypothetical protein
MSDDHELKMAQRMVNRSMPGLGMEYHLVCSCGKWQSPWRRSMQDAWADAGGGHDE